MGESLTCLKSKGRIQREVETEVTNWYIINTAKYGRKNGKIVFKKQVKNWPLRKGNI